jgi:hypothetical protein
LYYAGLRVDGSVVVKRKYNGGYVTLLILPYLNGPIYDKEYNPSLIPKDVWIGLRMETENLKTEGVKIRLCLDVGRTGSWQCPLEVVDREGASLKKSGSAGIRTDFMDVEFKDYLIESG